MVPASAASTQVMQLAVHAQLMLPCLAAGLRECARSGHHVVLLGRLRVKLHSAAVAGPSGGPLDRCAWPEALHSADLPGCRASGGVPCTVCAVRPVPHVRPFADLYKILMKMGTVA